MKNLLIVLSLFLSSWTIAQTYSANQPVLISWNGDWYPGKILEIKEEGFLITYNNFESTWNEVVGTERLKPIEGNESLTTTSNENTETDKKELVKTEVTLSKSTSSTMESKVSEMCACQKAATASGSSADKAKCMDLRDLHLASFEKDSEDYYTYKRLIFECQQ